MSHQGHGSPRPLHGLSLSLLALQLSLAATLGGSPPAPVAGGGLLVAVAALKLRSSRSARQLRPIVLAELLTLGLLGLQPPALGNQLLQGFSAVLLLAALIHQEAGGTAPLLQVLRRSLALAPALLPPLALLVVLPRWGPPVLTDRLDPGSLSALHRSMAPALRIRWRRGSPPPPALRYWRVLVLDRFDGRRWSASPQPPRPPRTVAAGLAEPPDQLWQAEPMPEATLPWPGHGRPSPATLSINRQGMLLAPPSANSPQRYGITLESAAAAWLRQPPQATEGVIPAGSNPQLERLGASWRSRSAAARIQAAEQLFHRQGLRYTTTPAPLPSLAPLDALLFRTREGFCEHLASAFTALMRAAGLPARVVVGYQGGSWVAAAPWGPGYLDVRQSEAHAWSEVWLEGRGWQRIDPTAWVAPERLTAELAWRRGAPPWRRLEQAWQQLLMAESGWQALSSPGHIEVLRIAAALALGAGGWALLRPKAGDDDDRHRRRLERSLALLRRWNLQPEPGETLQQFCQRAAEQLPALRQPLLAVATRYDQLRFSGADHTGAAQRAWHAAERVLRRSLQRQLRRRRRSALQRAHPSSSASAP